MHVWCRLLISFFLCFFSTWGRVWVHHLSLSSGHRRNSNGQWLSCPIPWFIKTVNSVYTEFIMIHSFAFIYICQQIEKLGQSLPEWQSAVAATANRHSGGGLYSSSGGELKLYLGCTGSIYFFISFQGFCIRQFLSPRECDGWLAHTISTWQKGKAISQSYALIVWTRWGATWWMLRSHTSECQWRIFVQGMVSVHMLNYWSNHSLQILYFRSQSPQNFLKVVFPSLFARCTFLVVMYWFNSFCRGCVLLFSKGQQDVFSLKVIHINQMRKWKIPFLAYSNMKIEGYFLTKSREFMH